MSASKEYKLIIPGRNLGIGIDGDLDVRNSKHTLVPLKVAYKKLRLLVDAGCIFIGHGLKVRASLDFSLTLPSFDLIRVLIFLSLLHIHRKISGSSTSSSHPPKFSTPSTFTTIRYVNARCLFDSSPGSCSRTTSRWASMTRSRFVCSLLPFDRFA